MIFAKYTYPLHNNGCGYSFSEQELIKLLDSVYNKGFKDGISSSILAETTYAISSEQLVIDTSDMYDNN